MSPVARRRFLLILTALLLLGATAFLTLIRIQQPIEECLPSEILYGACEPPTALDVFASIGIAITAPFLMLLGIGFVVRAAFRALRRRMGGSSKQARMSDIEVDQDQTGVDPSRAPARSVFRHRAIAILSIVAIFGAGVVAGRTGLVAGPADNAEFGLIREAWDLLHDNYVQADDLDPTGIAYAAIDAMATAVGDTDHTRFLPPDEAARMEADLAGSPDPSESDVDWAMVPGTNVALVGLSVFSKGVADDLAGALNEIRDAHATGLILDLRGNPGGWVDEAVDVASEFIVSGVVTKSRDAAGLVRAAKVHRSAIDTTTPLVVLVDGESMSSSEVVASALAENNRATLVGQATFGTGTGLDVFELGDGSALLIGVQEWLTGAGQSVWHTGIAPEVRVSLPEGALPLTPGEVAKLDPAGLAASGDSQLLRAVELLAP